MSASASVRGALLGWWKITSFHVELEDTGECVDIFGVDPLGQMVITNDRMMSILTSRGRTDKDAAALFETMMAYSGSCHVEDEGRLVIKVDAAWHPAWVGTEQVRFFSVDGDTLSITTAWQTHPKFPGRMARGVLTAQRL
ncbi:lipocalin-like domain-containing protein [Rhizobium sp. 2YAF20]|uniref:lipocalin-like domain-containing protein n=1 Tax=Rhizobium sp. 2YAF20 TaxID=3233027 RepID=UPI003F9B4B7D